MSSTILIALGVVGFVALIIGVLMFVHKKDQRTGTGTDTSIP